MTKRKTIALISLTLVLVLFLAIYSNGAIKKPAPLKYVNILPGSIMAITIPPFGIFIEEKYALEGSEPGTILAHEKIHWLQYQERGLFKFYLEYLSGWIKLGRFYNDLEKEARERSET